MDQSAGRTCSILELLTLTALLFAPGLALAQAPPTELLAGVDVPDCEHLNWQVLELSDGQRPWWGHCLHSPETAQSASTTPCHTYLLLRRGSEGPALETLIEYCEDGHGARGAGTDEISLSGDRVIHTQRGGSNWQWSSSRTWDLTNVPASLIETSESRQHIFDESGATAASDNFDLARNRAHYVRSEGLCTAAANREGAQAGAAVFTQSYTAIPVLWDRPELGLTGAERCAVRIAEPYYGENRREVSYSVVALGDSRARRLRLLANLTDPERHLAEGPSAPWLGKDHWELWLGYATPHFQQSEGLTGRCLAPDAVSQAVQLVFVPLRSGAVVTRVAHPPGRESLERFVAAKLDPQSGRLELTLSGHLFELAAGGRITLAYSDSIRGERQGALIGNSKLTWGKPYSFGALSPLPCEWVYPGSAPPEGFLAGGAGPSALAQAITQGDTARVAALIADGADPDLLPDGRSTLSTALRARRGEVVRLLMEAGADIELRGPEGRTPLMDAAGSHQNDALALLLAKGADLTVRSAAGRTALEIAWAAENYRGLELLLAGGAPLDATPPEGANPLLIDALFLGHRGLARVLLEVGEAPTLRSRYGITPLMAAAYAGELEIAEVLLARGVPVNAQNEGGETALMYAAKAGQAELAGLLLRAGADAGLRNTEGATALDLARNYRHQQLVELLGR